jgi:hydroxypyruvate isomerase
MDRRAFTRTLAGAALGAAAIPRPPLAVARSSAPGGETAGVPFKLSVMLWTVFHDLPFEERLENVAAAGYHAVELVGEFAHWSEDDFRRVNRQKQSLGMSFDTTAGLKHAAGDPGEREALLADIRRILPVMEKLECPSLIVMSGDVVPGMSRLAQHGSCVEGLKRAAEVVEAKGVTLLLENIDPEENPRYFLTSVAEGFEIVGEVNHPRVKFLYDFFHEQISEGNLIEKLERNIEKVGLVHVADVPGRHEPGTGEINYTNIYRKLAALHYDRYVAMEFLPTRDPVETLRAAREMALRAGHV